MAERSKRVAGDRLNMPAPPQGGFQLPRITLDSDAFGRAAEAFARVMGTARFLFWMTVFVVVWIGLNITGIVGKWDPYPFILLNLAFSTQASYAAPLILLAQNRQDARDRMSLEEDRRVAAQSRADMEFLAREIASIRMNMGDLATRDYIRSTIRNELRDLLADLDREDADHPRERKATSERRTGERRPEAPRG